MNHNHTKYIFVTGGVMSSVGKGVATASLAYLLKKRGYKVTAVKYEGYLNVDSGTINPIQHGDPFLCEDGTEADMDLGTYERYLNQVMGAHNFYTFGKILNTVLTKERSMFYQGEDVVPGSGNTPEDVLQKMQDLKGTYPGWEDDTYSQLVGMQPKRRGSAEDFAAYQSLLSGVNG